MAIVDALLPEYDHEMATTRKLLERVPEAKFAWKPHPTSFTLGELATHVATIPMWGEITIERSELDTAAGQRPEPPASTADLLARFDGHSTKTRAARSKSSSCPASD